MLPLLLLSSLAHAAVTPTGGVAGGVLLHGPDSNIYAGPVIVGRLGIAVTPAWVVEANVGYSFATTKDRGFVYHLWNPRLDALYGFTPDKRLNPFVRFGFGGQGIAEIRPPDPDDPKDDGYTSHSGDFLLELGAGAMVWLAGPVHLRADAVFQPSFGDSDDGVRTDIFLNGELTLGIELKLGPNGDKDGDGIKDKQDSCVDEPEDVDGFEDTNGCPDPDNDADGLADADDACRDEPEDKDGFEDTNGCPDPDNDADGVVDAADKCINDAEDKDGFEDADGCPDEDNDKDGVPDGSDKCPLEAEVLNGYRDRDGCPDEIPPEVKKFSGKIEGITFETGSATIKKSSFKVLDAAIVVLNQYPDVRMEIQGHTDDVGDDARNLQLSQDRAQSVVDYFVTKGVAKDRLVAKGYGETKPMVPNDSKANQQLNRRVEFHLIQ
jgi:outer membrane protein OmpA-like peptidoglycan-associated protein